MRSLLRDGALGSSTRGGCASLALVITAGCLSIEGVELREEEAAPPTDGFDAPGDGDGGQVGQLGQPCIDRGEAIVDGVTVQGLSDTCNGEAVCVAGVCQEEPVCAPGVDTECRIDFAVKRGPRTRTVRVGEHLYWFETGTNDTLGNYQHDGALVRTKPGEWLREQVLNDLDFFSEQAGERTGAGIFAGGGYVYADTWIGKVDDMRWDSISGELTSEKARTPTCISDEGTEYIPVSDATDGYAIVRTRAGESWQLDRPAGYGECFIEGDVLWTAFGARHDLRVDVIQRYPAVERLIDFEPDRLVQVRGSFVSVATPDGWAAPVWRNVMRIVPARDAESALLSQYFVEGDELTFTRLGTSRMDTTVLRTTLGAERAQVIAELSLKNHAQSPFVVMTKGGLVYHDGTLPHFVPLAEVEP